MVHASTAHQIFDRRARTDSSVAAYGERTYAFLDRVDDPAFDRVRTLLEAWYAAYPSGDSNSEARELLRSSLRSGDDDNFHSAFWELYVHESFRRLGYRATPHPEVEGGRRPDFRFTRGDGASFVVEAKLITALGVSGTSVDGPSAALLNAIESAFDPDFSIQLHYAAAGPKTPRRRAVVAPLEAWLSSLSWRELRGQPLTTLPRKQFEADGASFECSAWPKAPQNRDDRSVSMIALHPSQGGVSSMRRLVLDALRSKARKYGHLGEPFVIALAASHWVSADHDFEEALYGPEIVRISPNQEEHEPELDREPRGLWQRGRRISGTRVSAVLGAPMFSPYSIARSWPRLWTNPWAAHPITVPELPWPRSEADLDTNMLRRVEALGSPADFFELDADWPGEPFSAARTRRRHRRFEPLTT